MAALDDTFDFEADNTIIDSLNLKELRSFFLYAGAGSGKTRSLVKAVSNVLHEQGRHLSLTGQKVGVITYTNAACDEIKQRIEFDSRVEVSTIHSFAWSLIGGHDADIRKWLSSKLLQDISDLEAAQAKGRATSQAAAKRARSIESKRRRHAELHKILRFVYSPSGDNQSRDSLSHAEVISITAEFLTNKAGLQSLLVSNYPILLIDESQDTNRELMDALLIVEAEHCSKFCLGLIGDTMQRIYGDGKDRLVESIPSRWARPRKRMNHRCPTRVIELINKIREDVDGEQQVPRSDADTGFVGLFIVPQTTSDPTAAEASIASKMAELTGDQEWLPQFEGIKTLALEHRMSARRFGFDDFFKPLYAVEHIRTSFLQGTGAGIGLFTREILPLVVAMRAADRFAVAAIIRRTSPLLERRLLERANTQQTDLLRTAQEACEGLFALVSKDEPPTLRAVLAYVAKTKLFAIPDVLAPFAVSDEEENQDDPNDNAKQNPDEDESDLDGELGGWNEALEAPFDQIEKYDRYVRGASQFDTHQGVKGLEFPRVMVVVSDEEARGFLFAYDKLFGAKEKTKTDLDNEAAGKETTIDRTRRLFYVTCSRAERSLAIVYYTTNPERLRDLVVDKSWFLPEEIHLVQQ